MGCQNCCAPDMSQELIQSARANSTMEVNEEDSLVIKRDLRGLPSIELRSLAPIYLENTKNGYHENIRESCQILEHMRVEGKIDNTIVVACFNDEFFEKYENAKLKGQLKEKFYQELKSRYNYPNPVEIDDILYLFKELAEDQYEI